jgi:hypothetical protein
VYHKKAELVPLIHRLADIGKRLKFALQPKQEVRLLLNIGVDSQNTGY